MSDLNISSLLGSPQSKRWAQASQVKNLEDVTIPYPLEVWNYEACDRHDKPTPDCRWHKCGGHPFKHQNKTASFSYIARRSLVGNSTGTGKQQPVTEPVLTPSGWTTMGQLRPGDLVVSQNGRPTEVLSVHPQTERRTYKVTFSDKSWTLAGPDHLWTAGTKSMLHQGYPMKVVTTMDMANSLHRQWSIPMTEPVEFDPQDTLPCDPYLLGIVLGDGQINKYGASTICTDLEIISNLGLPLVRPHETSPYTGYANVPHSLLGEALPPLSRSWEKSIPLSFMRGSSKDRLALLQGLLDSDGSPMCTGGVEFSSTSYELAEQVVELTQSLGGVARRGKPRRTWYTHNGERRQGRESYRINVKLPPQFIPFRLTRKLDKFVPPTKYLPKRVVRSIERVEDQESVCIRVSAEDSLYLTRNYIVTHNTLSALLTLALAHHYGERIKAIVVVPTISVKQWHAETERWTPGFKTISIPSKTPKRDRLLAYASKWDVLIMGNHAFTRDVQHINQIDIDQVIVDDIDPALSVNNQTWQALSIICNNADLVIDMNATSLQAQPLDSRILTPTGWATMGDMKVGSEVLTPSGSTAHVLGVSERRVEPVYRVTLSDGSSTKATGGHLWEVSYASVDHSGDKPQRIRKTQVLTTEELLKRGLHVKRGPGIRKGKPTRYKFQIPSTSLEELLACPDLPIDPYVLGVLLGDGSIRKTTPTFSSADPDIVEEVASRLGEGLYVSPLKTAEGCVPVFSLRRRIKKMDSNPITESLRELGLHGLTGPCKFIPPAYMMGSYQQRLDLLRGLMDTDGTSSKGGCLLYTTSPQLAEDTVQLVRSLGGWAKSVKRTNTPGEHGVFSGGCGYIYYVTVVLSKDSPFHLSRKSENWTPNVRRSRSIESIELVGEEEAQCILIDDPRHLYVTDDYIATHNTNLSQLYAASCLIGGQDVWGSIQNFNRNYIRKEKVWITTKIKKNGKEEIGKRPIFQAVGYRNLSHFKKKFDPMSIRITYEDIADDVTIPALVTEQVYLDMTKKQRDRYTELQGGVRTILGDNNMPDAQKAINALTAFTIGSQICAGTFALKTTSQSYEPDGPEASPKLDWIMDKLTDDWTDEKVVVYAKFRGSIIALQKRLESEGIGFSTIWGVETDADVRNDEMTRFWEDPNTKVMIISVSGERSLNLQNASILVMWDLQLNPARVAQIAGRVRRVGSTHKRVFVFELLMSDTQEERYMAALAARQTLFDFVYDVDTEGEDADNLLIQKLDTEQILRLIQP